MAGLTRKTFKLFGGSGTLSNFGQFGSKQAGLPQTSLDPTIIQQLAAYLAGWSAAISGSDKAPYLQDMNGVLYVLSWAINYIYQMGVPEYDSGTLYFTGSVVQVAATGQQFRSLQGGVPGVGAGQSGNTPPAGASNAFWQWINPAQVIPGSGTLNVVPKVTNATAPNGVTGSVVVGDSAISDDATNVIIALPLKFADATVQTTAAINTAVTGQAVVTGSRASGIVYQNMGLKPMFIGVSANVSASQDLVATTDANPAPTTEVAHCSAPGGASAGCEVFFIVLPGAYYKVVWTGSLTRWTEWV